MPASWLSSLLYAGILAVFLSFFFDVPSGVSGLFLDVPSVVTRVPPALGGVKRVTQFYTVF